MPHLPSHFVRHVVCLALMCAMHLAALPCYSQRQHLDLAVAPANQSFEKTAGQPVNAGCGMDAATPKVNIGEAYGKLPLSFEANQGQADSQIKFLSRGSGYSLFLTPSEAVFTLSRPAADEGRTAPVAGAKTPGNRATLPPSGIESASVADAETPKAKESPAVLRMRLVGASAAPRMTGLESLPGKSNYFTGNDRRQWRTGIASYGKVKYEGVYLGIDLVYYGKQRQLEYDFVIGAGADPRQIQLSFSGAEKIELKDGGELVLHTAGGGQLRQHKPVSYQQVNGERQEVSSRYVIKANGQIGFEVGEYDASRPLVIDPILDYSTYLGGSGIDSGHSIAVDSSGNVYVTGTTTSLNFPTAAPRQATFGGEVDVFVTKLNATGSSLVYSTYLGGSNYDAGRGIAVDADGNALLTGQTTSNNFPTANASQNSKGGFYDAFITKLDATGATLLYSTYLGGGDHEIGRSIALDSTGNAYVTGSTSSFNFPTENPYQASKGGNSSSSFKSTNGGSNWSPANTGLSGSNVYDLAFDPATTSTLYAAAPNGVFKSTDSGSNWNLVNSGIPDNTVLKVAVDPSTPSTVYAATGVGVFKSTDGGSNWSAINNGLTSQFGLSVKTLAIDPASPSTIYAVLNDGVLFKSIDGGANWVDNTVVDTNSNVYFVNNLAIDPASPSTLYALVDGGFLKSTNGGSSWGVLHQTMSDDVSAFVINPSTPSTLYAVALVNGVIKSTDGGLTWQAFNTGLPTNMGGSVSALAIDHAHPATLYAGTYSNGIFKTTDGGANWSAAGAGMTGNIVNVLAVDPANSSAVYSGITTGSDGFVSKYDPSGLPVYSTYLGGNYDDGGYGIAVDSSNNAYLAGQTTSYDFPTVSPLQAANPSSLSAFVTKINAAGSALDYSTYLGGTGNNYGFAIAVDSSGSAYVTGQTNANNFPVTAGVLRAYNTTFGIDGFVTKFNPAGSTVAYSTYLGGTNNTDYGSGIAVDSAGNAYVTGRTRATDFPAVNPVQTTYGGSYDAFVTKLNTTGSAALYSTYLGGSGTDYGHAIAVDSSGSAYVTGQTFSHNFPTARPLQSANASPAGVSDLFITKLAVSYSIRGRVASTIYNPVTTTNGLGGITVKLSGSQTRQATTDFDGNYSFDNVAKGGNYTVMPASADYTYNPTSHTFNDLSADQSNQDFTATPLFHTISGVVKVGALTLPGVTMTLTSPTPADFAPRTVTTNSTGNFSLTRVPAGRTYKLTPTKTNYNFTPASKTYTDLSADQPNQTFTATVKTYTISGVVKLGTAGLGGVTVNLYSPGPNGFISRTVTTSSTGSYSFTNVPGARNYTVTPYKANYTVKSSSNASQTFRSYTNLSANQTNQNYTATLNTYTISGVVKLGTAGLSGVTMRLTSPSPAGFAPRTVTTSSTGAYTLTGVPAGRNYTLTPTKTGYVIKNISNASQTFRSYMNLSANQANQHFTATRTASVMNPSSD